MLHRLVGPCARRTAARGRPALAARFPPASAAAARSWSSFGSATASYDSPQRDDRGSKSKAWEPERHSLRGGSQKRASGKKRHPAWSPDDDDEDDEFDGRNNRAWSSTYDDDEDDDDNRGRNNRGGSSAWSSKFDDDDDDPFAVYAQSERAVLKQQGRRKGDFDDEHRSLKDAWPPPSQKGNPSQKPPKKLKAEPAPKQQKQQQPQQQQQQKPKAELKPTGPWAPPARQISLSANVEARVGAALKAMRKARGAAPLVAGEEAARPVEEARPSRRHSNALPVSKYRGPLMDALAGRVSIVEGATGSGKTTQVAQFVLEDAAARGVAVNIICTQPRRISAMSVAERVAAERGEQLGGTVGYAVRGASKQGPDTSLLFVTTGVLLRMMEEQGLAGVTHVIVDEVHERSVDNDFLLLTLRRLLAKKEVTTNICLMSATLDGEVLTKYYAGVGGVLDVPRVSFPGRTFPVDSMFLEDALKMTDFRISPSDDWHHDSEGAVKKRDAKKLAMGPGADELDEDGSVIKKRKLTRGEEDTLRKRATLYRADEFARRFPQHDASVHTALACTDPESVNVGLVTALVTDYVHKQARSAQAGPAGAVLVFLSGTAEIEAVREALQRRVRGAWVLPLHGALPPEEQRKCFERPQEGMIKVILATNVAETSVTIDDVTFVVDTGRVKELNYNAKQRIASLEDVTISSSAMLQRRGRAGRVRHGLCVHLFPSDAQMAPHTIPEVRRVPLEQLVMRVKALKLDGSVASICAELPEPPDASAVATAVDALQKLGALDASENLTALGLCLSKLPLDPASGKLLLLGACFGALDGALTISAALASRSPFMSPLEARDAADKSKKAFAFETQSDFLAVINAYDETETNNHQGGGRNEFAYRRFVSTKAISQIASLKRQLLEALSDAGFAPRNLRSGLVEKLGRERNTDGVKAALGVSSKVDRADQQRLLTALLCAALYPQICYVEASDTNTGKECHASATLLHMREPLGASWTPTVARIHPNSVASEVNGRGWKSPYVAFSDLCFTKKLYVRQLTPLPPLAPFLFAGGRVNITNVGGGFVRATLDGWLAVDLSAEAAELLIGLRAEIDDLFRGAVRNAGRPGHALVDEQRRTELTTALLALLEDAQVVQYARKVKGPSSQPKQLQDGQLSKSAKRTRNRNKRKELQANEDKDWWE